MKILIFCLCCLFVSTSSAQITSITEIDRGAKRNLNIEETQIIDINSKLEVSINKDSLIDTIKNRYPMLVQQVDIDKNITLLKEALNKQSTILGILEKKLPTLADKDQYYNFLFAFLDDVRANEELRKRFNDLSEEFRLNSARPDKRKRYAYIFANFENDMIKYKDQLKDIDLLKYSVSLLAFKKDKTGGDRVHVENFDTYSERDYFTVERWVTTLSEPQKEELNELASQAKENNEKALSLFEAIKVKFRNFIPNMECIKDQKNSFLNFIKDPKHSSDISEAIKLDVDILAEQVNRIIAEFDKFDIDLKSWSITKPFNINSEFEKIITIVGKIKLNISDVTNLLNKVSEIKSEALELGEGFTMCINDILSDLDELKGTIELIADQQARYLINEDIGQEVIAFGLDNLPSTGYINLKGTGERANGDELVLKVVLRLPSSKEGLPEQKITLEERDIVMQLIGARSVTAVGMILANPSENSFSNADNERKFFFAPSASLLLKFGSKKSYFYNDFLDFGVGINFAAPDFDTDGTPEFGLGLIATAFKDVISVGYNYNVNLDTTYWFFGINLPFNLPGLPVNPVKN